MEYNESNIKDAIFVTYGFDDFSKDKFQLRQRKPNREITINKPSTGLWASPVDSDYSWEQFLKCDGWRTETLSKHTLFRLNPNARIYVIDSYQKLASISNKRLPMLQGMTDVPRLLDRPSMNVDFLMENYDGVFVNSEMAGMFHCNYDAPFQDLNSWDCESICIWNIDVVEPIPEEEIEKIAFDAQHGNYMRTPAPEEEEYRDSVPDDERNFRELYGNRNMYNKQPFSQHPAILAQGDDNDRQTQLARKYNGTANSVLEMKNRTRQIIRESLRSVLNETSYTPVPEEPYEGNVGYGDPERVRCTIGGSTFYIEKGHSQEEWDEKFGNNDNLWDLEMSEVFDGTVEPEDGMVYWLIDGRLYETADDGEYDDSDMDTDIDIYEN